MGILIDDVVQQGDGSGDDVAEKPSEVKASHSVHSLDRRVVQSASYEGVPLEDLLAYADAQYYNNDTVAYDGDVKSPRQSILTGPLRHLWGPATPNMKALPTYGDKAVGLVGADLESSLDKNIQAQRMMRKVTALGAFYLITTDIFGPFTTGYAFSQVGYVPGVLCYLFLGLAAWYGGCIVNVLYLRLDSERYPLKTYGSLMARLMGKYAMIINDLLLFIQLIVLCGTIMLSNAQSLSQIIENAPGSHSLCFIVAIVIFLIVQVTMSPIRSLKGVGFFANAAVFLNVTLIFITIGLVTTNPPNYAAALASYGYAEGPVVTAAIVTTQNLPNRVNGIMNMVYAYGGSMIFVDFLVEMKRPWDLFKAMSCAQALIASVYMAFGMIVYSQQGQFTESLAYYGVSLYSGQTVGNVIAIIAGMIGSLLYGNIAQKQCYNLFVVRWCKGPHLMTPRGWMLWMVVNFFFWPTAFLVGAAIPQIQTISGLVAAIGILQFTYTFPFLMKVVFDVQLIAMRSDPTHTVGGALQRKDTWHSPARWLRAFFGGTKKEKLFIWAHTLLFFTSLGMACLGMYGSGTSIKSTFETGAATSFGCTAPA